MFEHYLELQLEHKNFRNLFLFVLILSGVFLGGSLYFEIPFFAFLILLAVALTCPFINFLKKDDLEELEKKFTESDLLKRHSKELVVFWILFVALVLGFYTALLINPNTYLYNPNMGITGITDNPTFVSVLLNNLGVFFLTFMLCLISVSAIIFIIQWSALLISLYMIKIGEIIPSLLTALLLLSHGLLEIGGYILAGFTGILISTKFDVHERKVSSKYSKQLLKDSIILFAIGFILIVLGAFIETF